MRIIVDSAALITIVSFSCTMILPEKEESPDSRSIDITSTGPYKCKHTEALFTRLNGCRVKDESWVKNFCRRPGSAAHVVKSTALESYR